MKKISISKKILSLSLCLAICFFAVSGLAAEDSDTNKLVELMDVMLEDFLNPSEPPAKTQQTQTASQKEQPAQTEQSVIPVEQKQTAEAKPNSVEPIEEKPLKTIELPKPVETAVPEHVPIVEEYITLDVQDDEPEEDAEPETSKTTANDNKKTETETPKPVTTENKITNTKKAEPVSETPKKTVTENTKTDVVTEVQKTTTTENKTDNKKIGASTQTPTTTTENKTDSKKLETSTQTQKTTTDNKTTNNKKSESKNSKTTTETQKSKKSETVTEAPKSKVQAKNSKTEKASEQQPVIRHEEIVFEDDEDYDDDEIEIISVEEDKPVPAHVEISSDKKAPQSNGNIVFKDDTNEIIGFDPFLYDDEPDFIYQPYVALGVEANKTTFGSAIKPIVGGDGFIQNFGMNIQYEKLIKPTISLGLIGGGTYNFKKDNKVFGMRLGLTGRKYFQIDSFRNLPYGFFVQGELGASAVYSNGSFVKDSKLNSKISPMGILKLGYRLYVLKSPMYFEPFVRGGYPLGVSAGITFGTNW